LEARALHTLRRSATAVRDIEKKFNYSKEPEIGGALSCQRMLAFLLVN